ncbi:MAG: hypothetical protein FWC38_00795 [Proteobacteria bacterium]|nr:hypothetical protein [Pseudomonadota bacterium]MCL2306780.1 hypothetical protein [Pseudomonadota bacterium]
MLDFKSIAASALASIETLLAEWLPHGRRDGHEYKSLNPTRADSREGSFSINLNTGAWADFATDDKGGDLIALYAYLNGVSNAEAAKTIANKLGLAKPKSAPTAAKKAVAKCEWGPVLPVPAHAGEPPKAHTKRGKPVRSWAYRDADGSVLGHVYRFLKSDGGKDVLPCVWARHAVSGAEEWRWMAFPVARPLYGLDRLTAHPGTSVVVVEGEKCADALYGVLPERPAVTWPGGCRADDKADWSPLAGRDVIVWPDFDDPGRAAARRIAKMLAALGCKVRVVDVPAEEGRSAGWDVADAVAEGWDKKRIGQFIVDHAREPKKAIDPTPAGAGRVSTRGGEDDEWRDLLLMKDGNARDCRENVFLYLSHHPAWRGVIWRNEFAHKVVRRKPAPWENPATFSEGVEWTSEDDYRMGMWLAQQERLIVRNEGNLSAAVGWCASDSEWHPVREYLDRLVWDGEERLDAWLADFMGVRATPYTMKVASMFLIGMVARIYQPGCMMRTMPIFEGAQYQGKSSALRILGGEWFGDTLIDISNKDVYQLIQGCWLYEVAELDAFSKADATRIKAFLSSPKDRFRAPYDRQPRDWARQVVFAGTTNLFAYLKDSTGNTRYWPITARECGEIELDALAAARDQLFAEAVVRFRKGERWHPSREEQQLLFEPEQDAREIEDVWEAVIACYLHASTESRITTAQLIGDALKAEVGKVAPGRSTEMRIAQVMFKLGWGRSIRETTGKRQRYYARPAVVEIKQTAVSQGSGDECPF